VNKQNTADIPVQPVDKPIICTPYDEPADHWVYNRQTGEPYRGGHRRPAGYYYKTERIAERRLIAEEERDLLPLVNALRDDVRRWRDAGYRGASKVTRDLLQHWSDPDLKPYRLFFCQKEAVETVIYLAELRMPGKSSRTRFQNFALSDENLQRMLRGEVPRLEGIRVDTGFVPTLIDPPAHPALLPLTRLGCKMATGSGKTVVMAMLITWAFANRGVNPASTEYPNAVLVVCPNLTIKERLQVLRPDNPENYYDAFDLVPVKYRTHLQNGKVLVTNWHAFAPESEHSEGGTSYTVVDKGPETKEAFARRILGDLHDRMPIMVLNDEGHHCWRPAPSQEDLKGEDKKAVEEERRQATVWIEGLDRINNAFEGGEQPGISLCVDLSATPFYIKGSDRPEGQPFPWLVSDFGLVDAIECGIVKIPRLPVSDTTGRPEPKYFRLWRSIVDSLAPADRLPSSGRPKPEVVYREAEAALRQIAGQWVERFEQVQRAKPGRETIPPALIVVCDNTEIAKVVFENISGQTEEEVVTEEDVEEAAGKTTRKKRKGKRRGKKTTRTVYGEGKVQPEHLSNGPDETRTFRIDSKLLAEAESDDPSKKKSDAAEDVRRVVSTVGKPGMPGEKIRCVVSVAMLNEGWDASNVTHILGLRAFDSQLLCEQVVGRGLRRMDYDPDPDTGMLSEEYVDVYGIPFTVIPFKGRTSKQKAPEDKPLNHVRALSERRDAMEMRFPVVEGFIFDLKKNLIRCDVAAVEGLDIEPAREPTATFIQPTIGYREGPPSQGSPFAFEMQDRKRYYERTHIQTIKFQIASVIVHRFTTATHQEADAKGRVLRLQSRHQLFPQVFRIVDQYVDERVNFRGVNRCELGLQQYVERVVDRLCHAIEPDETQGEPPLLPVLNTHEPIGTTADVNFKTTRPCRPTAKSHISQVVADTGTWEQIAWFQLEACDAVAFYARNDHLGLAVPYQYLHVDHDYYPDFVVRLTCGVTVLVEMKGWEKDEDRQKHVGANRWVSAVNHWGRLGRWAFHVCRDPQLLGQDLTTINETPPV